MSDREQEIWKAFCGELIQEPTDDMREALVTSIRKIVELYDTYCDGEDLDHLIWTDALVSLANELERLKCLKP